jgi:hypothetical protein
VLLPILRCVPHLTNIIPRQDAPMAIHQQATSFLGGLTGDPAALFASLTPGNIGSIEPIVVYGNLRVFMLNGY